jgi:CheY-like chemotaxis protein
LIVLDLAMPEIDGHGVLKELQECGITSHTFVIVMTANPQMATGEVEAIADYVMYKPIDVTEFAHFAKRMSAVSKGQR